MPQVRTFSRVVDTLASPFSPQSRIRTHWSSLSNVALLGFLSCAQESRMIPELADSKGKARLDPAFVMLLRSMTLYAKLKSRQEILKQQRQSHQLTRQAHFSKPNSDRTF